MNKLIQLPPENVKLIDNTMYKYLNANLEIFKLNIRTKIHLNNVLEISVNTLEKDIFDFNNVMWLQFNNSFKFFESESLIEEVSKTGIQENIDLGVGSRRFSTCSKHLASILNHVLSSSLIQDYIQVPSASFYSVADYFRFMRYSNGGEHFPHYDSDFIFSPDYVTKYSLVAYHQKCEGGEIFFCNDSDTNSKEKLDWNSQATEKDIYLKIKPSDFKIVIFPHELCHGVSPYLGTQTRDIIRGDLIFKTNQ